MAYFLRQIFSRYKFNSFYIHQTRNKQQSRNNLKNDGSKEENPTPPELERLIKVKGDLKISHLFKPLIFTLTFSLSSLKSAAIWQYENKKYVKNIQELFKKKGTAKQQAQVRKNFNEKWYGLSEGERIFIPIFLFNVFVFLLWRVPALQKSMLKYFLANPAAKNVCWPMILSTFSQISVLHIFINMSTLFNLSLVGTAIMGMEQFVGFYLGAAVFSTFVSYVYRVIANCPMFSHGASGPIMAILGYLCATFPDNDISLAFHQSSSFKASTLIEAQMLFELVGMLLRWRFIDHAAHFGGIVFGIFWSFWGSSYVWNKMSTE